MASAMADTLQLWLYHLEQWATQLVQGQLQHLSPLSLLLVGLAGLVTSLSPCMLSLLPVTIGYIGGYAPTTPAAAGEVRWQVWVQSLGFAAGVALTLSGLGLGAALLGRVYGQTAAFGSLVAGGIAILMGLTLVVLTRFFEYQTNLMTKSAVLVVCGIGVIWLGLKFERRIFSRL